MFLGAINCMNLDALQTLDKLRQEEVADGGGVTSETCDRAGFLKT